ncbi:ABC transporter ATP-binding protein [Bacillus sp. SM2101]|uniref:ABC transporter ATP-binding protein n=1 Tax=Bacillus sp. SM2101 TaxID=2805366 RepID=UPI001BDE5AF5|nr:ABC transporter ATP-binding protein [Bacillus sp. SM2101]
MIEVAKLRYQYPGATEKTIRGLDFSVNKGEIFGFLGPSGAGKSTTQKILIGLLKNYEGSVKVNSNELHSLNSTYYEQIGVAFEFPNFYQKFTALENLRFFNKMYAEKTSDPEKLLKLVGLEEYANVKVSKFSKGMKMRLNFCRALLNNPNILFLDEPTSGLDPVNAKKIKDLILAEKERGTTIIITTHNMLTAEHLCDRVAFIVDGTIAAIDSPKNLKLSKGRKIVKLEYRNNQSCYADEFPLMNLGENEDFQQIIRNYELLTIHTQEATLEDIFIEMTGRRLA